MLCRTRRFTAHADVRALHAFMCMSASHSMSTSIVNLTLSFVSALFVCLGRFLGDALEGEGLSTVAVD
jgi:hypothetical protein